MYESGYSLNMFQILENELVNFFNYIPIDYYLGDKRKEIFSPKLSELLIRIGSQIDIFFRNWDAVQVKNRGVPFDNLKFGNYKAIDINLDNKEILILVTDEKLKPFDNWKRNDPDWWYAYNYVKHNGFINKKEGNLFNVVYSLSALFLINCINKETTLKLIEYGYYNFNPDESREIKKQIREIKTYGGSYIPSSPRRSQLFEYEAPNSTPPISSFQI